MPLFACAKCNCVEDTSLSHFWSARLRQKSPLCSVCDPTIGKWHNEFPREIAQGFITDRNGFLVDKQSVERWLGKPVATFRNDEAETTEGSDAVKANILALDTPPPDASS
jgi:hypothetical protein